MPIFILQDIDITSLINAKAILDNAIKIAQSPLEKLELFNVLNIAMKYLGK